MPKNYTNINLTVDESVALAALFNFAKPEELTETALKKLNEEIFKKIEELKDLSVPDYIAHWREEQKAQTVQTVASPLGDCTFESLAQKQAQKLEQTVNKRAMKLVRVMISSNNPTKHNYKGEIITAQNSVIPAVKKFIPFNAPTHIPQILYNILKDKQMQIFYSEKLPNGRTKKRARLVPEYNIQVLEPLTAKELEAIKQKQLAENSQLNTN